VSWRRAPLIDLERWHGRVEIAGTRQSPLGVEPWTAVDVELDGFDLVRRKKAMGPGPSDDLG